MLRVFDFALSSLAILCLSPFLLPVLLLLKLTGEHEVFYLQERIGRDGKPFRVVKLATMLKLLPRWVQGPDWPVEDGSCRLLDKTSSA